MISFNYAESKGIEYREYTTIAKKGRKRRQLRRRRWRNAGKPWKGNGWKDWIACRTNVGSVMNGLASSSKRGNGNGRSWPGRRREIERYAFDEITPSDCL